MSKIPTHLLYTPEHEWVLIEKGVAFIGVTDHAQDQLGDIVYLGEFAPPGTSVEAGDIVGVIESVKATSDIFTPLSGTVVEVNEELIETPESINDDPYAESWMLKIKLTNKEEVDDLLSPDAYENLLD